MTALNRVTDALQQHGCAVRGRAAQCPAHEDRSPSLSIGQRKDGNGVVLNCHAGCATEDVTAALGLTMADLYDEPREKRERPQVVAEYPYVDECGELLLTVKRLEPGYDGERKTFRQYRPDGSAGVKGVRRVLYRLPDVLAQVAAGGPVFVVEGEKDADNLAATGAVATCNIGGAGKWREEYAAVLRGASEVVVIADRDEPGRKHAATVAESVRRAGAPVQVLEPAKGKDVSDHLAAGLAYEDLVPCAEPDPPSTAAAVQLLGPLTVAERGPAPDSLSTGEAPPLFKQGGAFFQDVPEVPAAVWGQGSEVLWAEGEALLIAAPQGVGKTTLAHQVIRARIGLQETVLGYPVAPGKRVLLLAMDRPAQTRRAGHRIFGKDDPAYLNDRLVIWEGPPPFDLAKRPEILAAMCERAGADTVVIDSLKDAAIGLSEDEVGAGYNRARQKALAEGVQVLEAHHLVKRGPNGAAPNKIEDVYGSVWITSGAGSVLLLWGEAGDPVVSLRHLKQPMDEIGPLHLSHDHATGQTTVLNSADLLELAHAAGSRGLTAIEATEAIFETKKPSRAQKEKARRRLEKLADAGQLIRIPPGHPGGSTTYRIAVPGLA